MDRQEEAIASLRREMELRHAGLLRELDATSFAVTERLEKMIAVRDQLREQAATFVRRDQYEASLASLQKEIGIEREARIGQEGAINTWRFIAGFLGLTGIVGATFGILQLVGA